MHLDRITASLRHEATTSRTGDRRAETLCGALERGDFDGAIRLAEEVVRGAPAWGVRESAFNALLGRRETPGTDPNELERILDALPDDRTRTEALEALRRTDWTALERALDLEAVQRLHVHCHRLLQALGVRHR